ncbi:hypothetical protein EAH89_06790 [Roseomonas nepalensis]|uniref:DUF4149 domain-containing protein n=1 Tax=Muricoccus nepalensis TaxID=1854500 RepID=A0A502GA58_9PROT|nr:hypothetical protein [Roseomonas nepalensis]TPG59057.1 hypothetical protein EAH89_06790 [Roseomonas nepalensis]
MTPNGFALLATIVLLGPMLYFLVTSLTFLLRPFSDPVVTWLLRGLFNVHFLLVGGTCGVAALAFLLASRPLVAAGIGTVAALAVAARRWFLVRIDAALRVRDAGDATALRRLRRLHWGGMAYNAAQFLAVTASVSRIFPTGV